MLLHVKKDGENPFITEQPYTDVNWLTKIRHVLLRWIAGKNSVMLNIRLSSDENNDGEFFVVDCQDFDGLLCNNIEFDTRMLRKNYFFKMTPKILN